MFKLKPVKLTFILSVLLVLFLALASCGNNKISLEGIWKLDGETLHEPFQFVQSIEFKNDGSLVTDSNSFPYTQYEVEDSKKEGEISVTFKGNSSSHQYVLKKANDSDDNLYITNKDYPEEYKDMVLIKEE